MSGPLTVDWLHRSGLEDLTHSQAEHFLQQLEPELERRVGHILSAGMSDDQLTEFDVLMGGGPEEAICWAERNGLSEELEAAIFRLAGNPALDLDTEVAGWGRAMWLTVNRPDYRDVVQSVFRQVRTEIEVNAARIVASYQKA